MADNDELLQLRRRARRRLLGAIALVLFLVIVPPMVMDLEPRPVSSNLSVDIPGKDSQPPLKAEPPRAVVAPEPAPAPTGVPKPAPGAETKEPAKEAAKEPPKEAPKDVAAKDEASYFVQLGVFANRERAGEIRVKVNEAGIRAYSDLVKTDAGEQARVRAGPFPSRDAAERARARLEELGKTLGFKPGPVRALDKRA